MGWQLNINVCVIDDNKCNVGMELEAFIKEEVCWPLVLIRFSIFLSLMPLQKLFVFTHIH